MKKQKTKNFSKRLVFIYSLIIIIPLLIVTIIICNIVSKKQYNELRQLCNETVLENQEIVKKNMRSFTSLEQMIAANREMKLFLLLPETDKDFDIVNYIVDKATNIENTLSVIPEVYALRIFTNNPIIPERWPIFLKSSRVDFTNIKRWEYNYRASYLGNLDQQKNESVCTTREITKNKRVAGYLQITMKMQDFFPFLYHEKNQFVNDYVFRVVERNGEKHLVQITNNSVMDIQGELKKKSLEKIESEISLSEKESDNFLLKTNGNKYYVSWCFIEDMNIYLVHANSLKVISKSLLLVILAIMMGLFCTILALFFVIRVATAKLMSGVYSVMNGMKEVRAGNYNVKIPVYTNDEVGETQQTFNLMTEQIKSQIEQIKKEQELISDTEIKAMQNQINVHFLYNVLETIKMQAVIEEQDDIVESITVLGKMMRYCLRWKVHIVPLAQEIEYARSYVYILNLRNDYKISLETEIEKEYETLEVPKMILQPLIENSFTHAIEPEGKDAVVKVFTQLDEKKNILYLCEQDFGCGMDAEQLKQIEDYLSDEKYERDSVGSIGLKNIQQRLTMSYGKDYKIKIYSEKDKGTKICIPLPLSTISSNLSLENKK